MSIISIQCLSDKEELLFPQVEINQIYHIETDQEGKSTIFNIQKKMDNFQKEIFSLIYPIGSILILESSVNPNEIVEDTTWENIANTEILVGKGYLDDNTSSTLIEDSSSVSGEYAVQITTATLPSHTHALYNRVGSYLSPYHEDSYDYQKSGTNAYTTNTGGGGYHSNIMPYITANIWTRTA